MVIAARFFREKTPAPASPDWDGFDFLTNKASGYQMVPQGGTRTGQIALAGGLVSVKSADSSVVALRGTLISQDSAELKFNSIPQVTRDITLVGLKEGRTAIGAFDGDKLLHSIIVSVKVPRAINYNLHILRDAVRPKDVALERTMSQLNIMMGSVEKIYFNSANVVLTKSKENFLKIPADLGDPFDPEASSGMLGKSNHGKVLESLKRGGFLGLDTVNVVSTWNIKDESETRVVLGLTQRGSRLSYVERIDGGTKEACTIAHEMGHGFGLTHNLVTGSMMARASGGTPSFAMLQPEIDFLNGSAGGALIIPIEPPE